MKKKRKLAGETRTFTTIRLPFFTIRTSDPEIIAHFVQGKKFQASAVTLDTVSLLLKTGALRRMK